MKKRYALVLPFVLFTLLLQAQQIGELPAKWTYNYDGFWAGGITTLESDGTSEVEGLTYHRLQVTSFWEDRVFPGNFDTINLTSILLRSGNGIVSCYVGNAFIDTLVNFNAAIGTGWTMPMPFFSEEYRLYAVVADTGHLLLTGQSHKWLAVDYTRVVNGIPDAFSTRDTVLEQIGNLHDFLLPWDPHDRAVDAGMGGPLRCYQAAGASMLSFNGFTCNTPVETAEQFAVSGIKCIPNPFQNELTITSETDLHILTIMDITGRPVLRLDGKQSLSTRIDTHEVAPGMYWLVAEGKNGERAFQKIIRQ